MTNEEFYKDELRKIIHKMLIDGLAVDWKYAKLAESEEK